MTDYDVVVVGAGASGLSTAINCAKSGLSVALVEEHKKIGFPRHCSGLYSNRLLSLIDVDQEFYEHEVNGAKFHSPSGRVIELMLKDRVAFVVNRELLDDNLGKRAIESGVDLISGFKVSGINIEKDNAKVLFDKHVLSTKLICGADGSNSTIAKLIGIKPVHRLHGIMAITNEEDYSKFVDLYFDNKLYPGFFAWKIPRGKTVEYGIAGEIGPRNVDNFNHFLEGFGVKNYEISSGVIPMGFQKSFSERVLLVGDAAAQVKPLTGGGVIYGMICAKIAAQVLVNSIKQNKFDENFLSSYQKMWRGKIGKGISRGLMIRKIYSRLSNSNIDMFFKLLDNTNIKNLFQRFGDMEFILERKPHREVFAS